jgi:hypothetical protein
LILICERSRKRIAVKVPTAVRGSRVNLSGGEMADRAANHPDNSDLSAFSKASTSSANPSGSVSAAPVISGGREAAKAR